MAKPRLAKDLSWASAAVDVSPGNLGCKPEACGRRGQLVSEDLAVLFLTAQQVYFEVPSALSRVFVRRSGKMY
jgi:hypothetical protein